MLLSPRPGKQKKSTSRTEIPRRALTRLAPRKCGRIALFDEPELPFAGTFAAVQIRCFILRHRPESGHESSVVGVERGPAHHTKFQDPSWRPRVHDCDVDGALTLRKAVADVYRRAFRPPFEIPAALLINALLMTAAWFLLPPRAHQFVERQSAVKVIAACVVIAIIPFGILPVAAWVGLLLPYHLRPLRWRWDRRRNWRLIARWALLAFSPFVIVPVVSAVIIFPSAALAHWAFGAPAHKLTNAEFVLVAVTACAMAVLVGIGGLWVAGRLRVRRHDRLATYLLDPAAG
jgi:hypothetical protein